MYDDYLLNNDSNIQSSSNNLDSLFDNLTNDINLFNKYVDGVNRQKKENNQEVRELLEEKLKIEKVKQDFDDYIRTKQAEYDNKMAQVDEYLNTQKQNLLKMESEFKVSMDNSLNELELEKKEFEIEKEKFKEEKEQFETYKSLELDRIKHSQEILESDKSQFEKYKDVSNKKIELENKNLEQKCDKFKELIGQFNAKFRPILKEDKEV